MAKKLAGRPALNAVMAVLQLADGRPLTAAKIAEICNYTPNVVRFTLATAAASGLVAFTAAGRGGLRHWVITPKGHLPPPSQARTPSPALVAVLAALRQVGKPMTVAHLARRTGQPVIAVGRAVRMAHAHGDVEFEWHTGDPHQWWKLTPTQTDPDLT